MASSKSTCRASVLAAAAIAALGLSACATPTTGQSPAPAAAAASAAAAPASAASAAAKPDPGAPKPFAEVIKDATRSDGLLPLWRKDEKVWLEIPADRLGKPLLVSVNIASSVG